MTPPEKTAVQGIAGLTLRNLIDWRNHFHPTGVWASRYIEAAEFETALDFLNWSEARELERGKGCKGSKDSNLGVRHGSSSRRARCRDLGLLRKS